MLLFCIPLAIAALVLAAFFLRAFPCTTRPARARRAIAPAKHDGFNQAKPQWVRDEVLRLKALMPGNGCRKIAVTFNHMHRRRMTVGKTFVASVLKKQGFRLAEIRRQIRRRRPRSLPKNVVWALDLTYLEDQARERHTVLGLIDHGTRACLALRDLPDKGSIAVLRALLDVIERFGKPKVLRTDNEAVFTSAVFRLGLRILAIRQQRTAPFAPWQNGRIERLFATFKALARKWRIDRTGLQKDLDRFRFWYNFIPRTSTSKG